ncbi:uncharacterized [Tachysurus ichikawai]
MTEDPISSDGSSELQRLYTRLVASAATPHPPPPGTHRLYTVPLHQQLHQQLQSPPYTPYTSYPPVLTGSTQRSSISSSISSSIPTHVLSSFPRAHGLLKSRLSEQKEKIFLDLNDLNQEIKRS